MSLNLTLMGSPSRAFGFAFGSTGRRIIDMLREGGVEPLFYYGETGESRTNYLLVEEETRDATLVADKGPLPGDDQVRAFYDLMRATSARATCWPCPATLQLPDPYIYNRIIDLLADKGVKCVSRRQRPFAGRVHPEIALSAKPNKYELGQLLGRELVTDADVIRAIADTDRYNVEIMGGVHGGEGSLVRAGGPRCCASRRPR